MNKSTIFFLALALLALAPGCKKDDNPVTPPNTGGSQATTYMGTFAGSSESGSIQ